MDQASKILDSLYANKENLSLRELISLKIMENYYVEKVKSFNLIQKIVKSRIKEICISSETICIVLDNGIQLPWKNNSLFDTTLGT